MQRDVRLILSFFLVPLVAWGMTSLYFFARSFTDKGFKISQSNAVQVSTHLVGIRYSNPFPDEMVGTDGRPLSWSNSAYSVVLNQDTRVMIVSSKRFTHDATLTYDGWRWQGFTHIPGRKLPVRVDVW